jgi:hypothetical protein
MSLSPRFFSLQRSVALPIKKTRSDDLGGHKGVGEALLNDPLGHLTRSHATTTTILCMQQG